MVCYLHNSHIYIHQHVIYMEQLEKTEIRKKISVFISQLKGNDNEKLTVSVGHRAYAIGNPSCVRTSDPLT